ncbi:unnamed protein product [Ceutorhynchus assimilis]|uniref:Uncharacterized protein n=1 Tax=Ceutorhynchus assimilis TaxID=467358 RepID=A0A9P0DH14_9CUCU|nr:unnamed protein product [Ceutorhynchus assimilis]
MMERLSEEEQKLWIEIMEEGESQMADPYSNWKMYVDACWESHPNLAAVKSLGEKFDLETPIKVCVLNPSFNIDEVDPELAIDVIILKTFDSLTSYEQLLIKCSAILGDIFPRDMLMYIMASSAVRLTALAVKKLFEIHVLSCARGNFLEGGLVFTERFKNPNENTEVACECQGLIIDEICQDLPKYASCGYMRFLSTTFRETTYNLLTDNQKREFHARAIRYLEKETRKCRACGNGYFTKHMGNRLDYDLKILSRKKTRKPDKKAFRSSDQTSGITGASILQESDTLRFSIYSQESGHSNVGSRLFRDSGGYSYPSVTVTSHVGENLTISGSNKSLDDEIEEGEFQMIDSRIGFRTINKYKDDYNITKTFSDADYSQCTCLLILNTMYTQMIEHCSGAGLVEKLMGAMIDFCYICIESQNVIQTLKILEEALDLLDGPLKQTLELEWMVTFKRGKLFAIMGYARLQMEQYDEGYKHLVDALDCYGKCWYYALCLSFHLETGLIIIPIHECITFSQGEGKEPAVRDPDSKKRLIVAIWLWHIRTENWEGAYLWEEDVMNFDLRSEGETIQNLLTGLYVLEGLIVNMSRKMDDKNIQLADKLENKIEHFFKKMLKAGESNKIILPRIYHFKAYYHVCMTNKYNETFKRMRKAVTLASNMGNDMEISWIIHNEQALCNKLSKQDKNFWRVHAEDDNHIEYNESDEYTEDFKHYTLPVPINL